MKKRALRKDFYMEIRRTINRFVSIFLIVALGVAFYSGIQSAAPDMEASGDAYFDRQSLMDFRVVSTLGLSETDVEALNALPGVSQAEGAYLTDVLYGEDESQKVVHVESVPEHFQKLQAEQGRLPEKANECFLDAAVAEQFGIQTGDILTVREDGEEEDWVLKNHSYTVVGIGASPAYISFGKGNTTLGSGEVLGFAYVLPEAFEMEVYPQIFLSAKGAGEITAFTEEYDAVIDSVRKEIEDIEAERCQIRYEEVRKEADEKIRDAEEELADGKKEAEEKIADAEQEIADGEEKLEQGKQDLEQGKKDLENAKQELEDAKQEIAEGWQELEDGKAELAEKEADLQAAKEELNEGWEKLNTGKQEFADAEARYDAESEEARRQIEDGESALAEAKAEYEQGMSAYESGIQKIGEAFVQLDLREQMLIQAAKISEEGRLAYEAAKPELENARSVLTEQQVQIEKSLPALTEAKNQIDTKSAELEDARGQLAEGAAQIEAARNEIAANEASLTAAQAQADDGQRQIDEGWTDLAEGEQELLDGEEELKEGEQKVADAEEEIARAEKTIAENEQKLVDGKADLEEAQQEVEDTIRDGEEKIADAKEELNDLELPEWTISDRDDLPDYTGYGENADRMRNIGRVFPVLFFLVAALISLTTMTRMVEEERTEIGTLKALGYGKVSIAMKYVGYALLATVGGSLFGVLAGEKILPFIIITAYGIMYQHMDVVILTYRMNHALTASGVALLCTMAGTLSACYRELSAAPAVLMRPPTPKEGKRVLLERIPLIWKHLSFTWKSTVRNLFRYKRRFFMTVFGIGGCMALLLVGFGLRDSIMDVAVLQYQEIQLYDGILILDEDAEESEKQDLVKELQERRDITAQEHLYMKKLNMRGPEGQYDAYLMVPEVTEGFEQFVNTRDRKTHKTYTLGDDGIILSEKTASILGLSVGDIVTIAKDENTLVEAKIDAICENYMAHYAYMSPILYEQVFEEKPEFNNVVFCVEEEAKGQAERIGQELLKQEAALSISYTSSIKGRVDDMLGSLDIVIVVLIVSAGMLAFVVLYNLNNINVNERKRELATLKVLGFYDREVSAYVYRENILLTLIGAAAGVVLGIILHRFVIITVEIEECMFGRNIKLLSFIISILITCLFSFMVNVVMHYKLKKIDMVESLKSVE